MEKTDWNSYYEKPFKTALIARLYTTRVLLDFMERYGPKGKFSITEIGGANSCFYLDIVKKFGPAKYIIVDNNQLGLDKFLERVGSSERVETLNQDILAPRVTEETDLVFSVGLIEHFDTAGTREVVLNHLKYLKKPGILILSFPTPTLLYRFTRWGAEMLSMWKFPDERPLQISEVEDIVTGQGAILEKKILWPIFLTQCMMVIAYPARDSG